MSATNWGNHKIWELLPFCPEDEMQQSHHANDTTKQVDQESLSLSDMLIKMDYMDHGRGCQWKAWGLLRSSRLFHSVLKWADSSRSVMSVSQLGLNSGKSLELRFIHIPSQENQQADRLLERERGQRNLKRAKERKKKKKKGADRQTDNIKRHGRGNVVHPNHLCIYSFFP